MREMPPLVVSDLVDASLALFLDQPWTFGAVVLAGLVIAALLIVNALKADERAEREQQRVDAVTRARLEIATRIMDAHQQRKGA